jgi:ABC-type uncharacterized transport system substrate-binding protein
MRVIYRIFIFIVLTGFLFISCNSIKDGRTQRIFYINSYHAGYGSSDDVMEGITETLASENVELKIYFHDAKRKTTVQEIQQSVKNALQEIEDYKPDLLIVSDDNAVKDLIVPYFNNTDLSIVFCGVNWSAEQYNLGDNVTGMLEVLPLRELLSEVISNYPETRKLVVLSENSLSEQNNRLLLDTLYRNMGLGVSYSLASDFETWQTMFLEANKDADIIYMPTNGAIKNWNDREAKKSIEENFKVPIVTCDDFMMPFAVFGLTKVAREQGEWAAQTALEILGGISPAEIPYTKNTQTKAWLNTKLANQIEFRISEEMKSQCTQL